MPKASDPIGVFDSGIGGLTVASAVNKLLPNERIVYFGDIAHLPYGDKSTAAIQAYSIKIADILIKSGCKVILIACNSASAAAYELVKEYAGSRAKVFNVIDPVVHYVREKYQNTDIGLIGTKQTVGSNVYKKKIDDQAHNVSLKSLATPLLVPVIEEGYIDHAICTEVIKEYLSKDEIKDIEALILGCTHYPLIKEKVEHFYQSKVEILDSSIIVAESLRGYLEFNLLLNDKPSGEHKFMVSDYTVSFELLTKRFFGQQVKLEKYPLWD